jgi:hypothetical protein
MPLDRDWYGEWKGIGMANAMVDLAAAIEALRTELSGAMAAGHGQGMQFVLEPIELTVQAAVTDEGNGKIGWKIVEFGGSRESAVTQTLKMILTPVWKRPDGTLVRDFTIASVDNVGDRIGPHS